MNLLTVPLSQLKPSKHNARKTGGQSIDDLAASIRAHGLLQNLTVIESGKGYEVVAGGRRLAALKQLSKAKALSGDYAVPCLLVANAAAAEASLAENAVREAMHPADQFEAFRQLIDGGKSIADTAAAFGVTETVVRQRLKLANVSPKLLVEYRAGNATLEQMQALAISDDHAAQEAAWGDDEYGYRRTPHNLRRMLTNADVSSEDARAVFVGLDAYEAAGGVVRRDLFGESAYLADSALLDRLVAEKLEATAEVVMAEGWAWVAVRPSLTWNDRSEYESAGKPKRRKFTDEEQASYDALETRYDELEQWIENANEQGEDCSDQEAEYSRIEAEMREMNESRDQWPAKIKAVAGALVFLDDDGINIDRGLLKPGERLGNGGDDAAAPVVEQSKPKKDPSALSQAQLERLWGERTAIIRQQIGLNAALAALAAELWESGSTDVRIGPRHTYFTPESRDALAKHPASAALEAEREAWQAGLEPAGDDLFGYLLKQPVDLSIGLIGLCVAENIISTEVGVEFARKAGINIADHWQVTEEWLAQQPKGYILAALAESSGGTLCTDEYHKLKAGELAKRAAPILVQAGWLPKPLRSEGGAA